MLNEIDVESFENCKSVAEANNIIARVSEPSKSAFEWLLDLCVEIIAEYPTNKMNCKSMAVVLCPVLFNNSPVTPKLLRAIKQFMTLAIEGRIILHKTKPIAYCEQIINLQTRIGSGSVSSDNTSSDGQSVGDQRRHRIATAYSISRSSTVLKDVPYKILSEEWNKVMNNILHITAEEMEAQAWDDCKWAHDTLESSVTKTVSNYYNTEQFHSTIEQQVNLLHKHTVNKQLT